MLPNRRVSLYDVQDKDTSLLLNAYEPQMIDYLSEKQLETFYRKVQSHTFKYGSTKRVWDRSRLEKGDIALIRLREGVILIEVKKRRAIWQDGTTG